MWEQLFILTELKIRNGDDHAFIPVDDFSSAKLFVPRQIHVRCNRYARMYVHASQHAQQDQINVSLHLDNEISFPVHLINLY
jgi:hypothetical protein